MMAKSAMTAYLLFLISLLASLPGREATNLRAAQTSAGPGDQRSHQIIIRCGTVIDGKSSEPRKNVLIDVEGQKIRTVGDFTPAFVKPAGAEFVDLSSETYLPGLIDTHTHTLLQGDQNRVSMTGRSSSGSFLYATFAGL